MKSLSIAFFCFITVIAFAGEPVSTVRKFRKVGESDPIPADGFVDVADLKKWASSSSFGGGGAERIEMQDKEVYYSQRCVTSMIPTHEIIFWMKTQDRFMPCLVVPLHIAEYRVERDGDDIVVKCWINKKTSEEVLRLKTSFFSKPLYRKLYSTQIVPAEIAPGTVIWEERG